MSFWSGKRGMVTGGAGFLGTHLVQWLHPAEANVFVRRRRGYDFVDPAAARRCLKEHPRDVLIHAAAYYGGIGTTRPNRAASSMKTRCWAWG